MDERFNVNNVLDALMADIMSPNSGKETDKALADALVRGAGYLRLIATGVEHVPYDHVRIQDSASEKQNDM
jgi:hypothetical protein